MWTKICGIADPEAAERIAAFKPDAVGLNFHAPSPRAVTPDVAEHIVRVLPAGVEPVGVFVDPPLEEAVAVIRRCGLQTVQLHGDEPPEWLAELQRIEPDLRIIRACRMGAEGLVPWAGYLNRCREQGIRLWACLVDARVEGVYGGSGRRVDWPALAEEYDRTHWPNLVLAGGLNPDNVAEAVQTVRPWGVDVASGVESSPAVKDLRQVEAFLRSARSATISP